MKNQAFFIFLSYRRLPSYPFWPEMHTSHLRPYKQKKWNRPGHTAFPTSHQIHQSRLLCCHQTCYCIFLLVKKECTNLTGVKVIRLGKHGQNQIQILSFYIKANRQEVAVLRNETSGQVLLINIWPAVQTIWPNGGGGGLSVARSILNHSSSYSAKTEGIFMLNKDWRETPLS